MEKEISTALHDFFQKVLKPELDEIKEKQVEHDGRFLDMLGHFDGVYKRLDRLDVENHSIVAGLDRLDVENHSIVAGLDRLEQNQERQGRELGEKIDAVAEDLKEHRRDTEAHKGGYKAMDE